MLRRALLIVVLGAALSPAHAENKCHDACMNLVREGWVLQSQGKYQDAMAKLQRAAAVAPEASLPLASIANLLGQLSKVVKPEQAAALRKQADAAAHQALRLEPDDPVAQEAQRMLADDGPPPLHQPNDAAASVLSEAEVEFAQHHLEAALAKYQEAMRLDPQASGAWVGAGDCYYMQKDWVRAQAQFQRATEIEPRNSQAWRYLSDALLMQKKVQPAEAALLSAIAADPSQGPNWSKLGALRAHSGMPLKRLQLRRGSSVTIGSDGKATVSLDPDSVSKADAPDGAVWLALAAVEAKLRTDKSGKKTPYEIELEAWQTTLMIADELKASSGKSLTDPALLQMQAFARDGQLEPAILLLLYKESYRPALEKWLAANPQGVNVFVTRYGLQP